MAKEITPEKRSDWKTALTCFSPNREVLVLLDVQHDLQAVPRSAFQCGQQRVAV